MTKVPTVSVIMPSFNRLAFLCEAVESVLEQSVSDWELIIVDDGSGAETRRYLQSLSDPRIFVHYHGHTGRPAVVRNLGIASARGRYIAFLDSDDSWMPEKLEKQLLLMMSNPDQRWSYTGASRIDANGVTTDHSVFSHRVAYSGSIVGELLTFEAVVATPTVMAEAAFVREVGCFDETLRFGEDYDLWLRMSLVSDVTVEPAPLCKVRSHSQHFTQDRLAYTKGKAQLFEKAKRSMPTAELRLVAHRRWAEHILLLAALEARQRNWRCMRQSLLAAIRGHAFNPKGWLKVFKAILFAGR